MGGRGQRGALTKDEQEDLGGMPISWSKPDAVAQYSPRLELGRGVRGLELVGRPWAAGPVGTG